MQIINDGNDYKSEIQEILREKYPTHFGVKRAFRTFSNYPVSQPQHLLMNRGAMQNIMDGSQAA